MSLALVELAGYMDRLGCDEILIKPLAPNDNSKNQPYIAKDRSMLGFSLLPASDFEVVGRNMRARIDLRWIDDLGGVHQAPSAKLIQYTRYSPPEVRLSGFLKGCAGAPNHVMNVRTSGRFLFLGVAGRVVYAYAVGPDERLAEDAQHLISDPTTERRGVLYAIGIDQPGRPVTRTIESRLLKVHEMGWITGQKRAKGVVEPYAGQNAGGMTLESVLGVEANSNAGPDLLGWEVKAFEAKTNGSQLPSKPVTLFTPNPTEGFYGEKGLEVFLETYGYPAVDGTSGRINFGGIHRAGVPARRTASVLHVVGLSTTGDVAANGRIELRMRDGALGAAWPFTWMLEKWNRKHSQAVYVPYERRDGKYKFSAAATYCRGSDFGRFLAAINGQFVYYDPALKLVRKPNTAKEMKARHQFRIKLTDVPLLYESVKKAQS